MLSILSEVTSFSPYLSLLGLTLALILLLFTRGYSFKGEAALVLILYRKNEVRFLSFSIALSFVLWPDDPRSEVNECSELVSYKIVVYEILLTSIVLFWGSSNREPIISSVLRGNVGDYSSIAF